MASVAARGLGEEARDDVCALGDAAVVEREAVAGGRGLGLLARIAAEASRELPITGRIPVTAKRVIVAAGRELGEASRAVEGVVHGPVSALRGLEVTARGFALTARELVLTVRELALTAGDAALHRNQIGRSGFELGASRGKSPVGWWKANNRGANSAPCGGK